LPTNFGYPVIGGKTIFKQTLSLAGERPHLQGLSEAQWRGKLVEENQMKRPHCEFHFN
jgi:hypothetical protein